MAKKQPQKVQRVEKDPDRVVFTSADAVAKFFDVHDQTIRGWNRRGCPGIQPRRYDISQIGRWLAREMQRRNPERAEGEPVDELMVGEGGSPALEKYRAARARVAEIQADEAERSVVRVDHIQEGLGIVATTLRGCGDKLQRRFGLEAKRMLDEHIDAAETQIDKLFG